MTGGISAIKGFDYQATVILDRLSDHFEANGLSASCRPEGVDDLDLYWEEGGAPRALFVQIKKPREDKYGAPAPSDWSIREAADKLLPNTMRNLAGNDYRQLWIVGDEIDADLKSILLAGLGAPARFPVAYWSCVHALAATAALKGADESVRRSLGQWKVPDTLSSVPASAMVELTAAFEIALKAQGQVARAVVYNAAVAACHLDLPDALERTNVEPTFGREDEVRQRVYDRLQKTFGLTPEIVEGTVFRNLRGFISDIAKQGGRRFNREEFELEMRVVWPHMTPVRAAPVLPDGHVKRPELLRQLLGGLGNRVVELTGVSGAGKTTLGGEIIGQFTDDGLGPIAIYVEVTPETTLRDVLVGVAFHLRRLGHLTPFSLASQSGHATDDLIDQVVRAFDDIPIPIWFVLDCVQGRAGNPFAKELASVVRRRATTTLKFVVLAQERILSALSPSELEAVGGVQRDLQGLNFEEFAQFAAHYGHHDRDGIYKVHTRLTAGKLGGLLPQMASALMRLGSVADMRSVAEKPPEERLAEADRRRFEKVSASARAAAEKLLCFAVPFTRSEAEAVFPVDRVGAALSDLLSLGLLRQVDDRFEIHETVRAGLEATIPRGVRLQAHASLAAWYGQANALSHQIAHLVAGGREEEANTLARTEFLNGRHWGAIASYVAKQRLVTSQEVVDCVMSGHVSGEAWQLPYVLRSLGGEIDLSGMIDRIRSEGLTLLSNGDLARPIAGAVLEQDPARLTDLLEVALSGGQGEADDRRREDAVVWLAIAKSRLQPQLDDNALAFIKGRSQAEQLLLARFLWMDGRRTALVLALNLYRTADRARSNDRLNHSNLALTTKEDVVELLAALPWSPPGDMLRKRSVDLGDFAELIWAERRKLHEFLPSIVGAQAEDGRVRAQGLRVLVFLGHAAARILGPELLRDSDEVAAMATCLSAVTPGLFERAPIETILMDPLMGEQRRVACARVLIAMGTSAKAMRAKLATIVGDTVSAAAWDGHLLGWRLTEGDLSVIPIAEAKLASPNLADRMLIAAEFEGLAEAPGEGVTDFLAKLVDHQYVDVQFFAISALAKRRSLRAKAVLVSRLSQEADTRFANILAPAVAGSGATRLEDLNAACSTLDLRAWRAIVAGRADDATASAVLVQTALDKAEDWRVRRAAIHAAGRLSSSETLEAMVPVLLREASPLSGDNTRLGLHLGLTTVLEFFAPALIKHHGSDAFRPLVAEAMRDCFEGALFPPTNIQIEDAVSWLDDEMSQRRPRSGIELLGLANELHLPLLHVAALRACSWAGRGDLIEAVWEGASEDWLAFKCLFWRGKIGERQDAQEALERMLVGSRWENHPMVSQLMKDALVKPSGVRQHAGALPARAIKTKRLGVDAAAAGLRGDVMPFEKDEVLVVDCPDEEAFKSLVALADPAFDHQNSRISYLSGITLGEEGQAIARTTTTSKTNLANGPLTRERLRPAIAAANRWGAAIPWHSDLVRSRYSGRYIQDWVGCLSAQADAHRFYEELERAEPYLLPAICTYEGFLAVRPLIDERVVPTLSRSVNAGDHTIFEGTCRLAGAVDDPAIDSVLSGLWWRWVGHVTQVSERHSDSDIAYGRGFNELTRHPRFRRIPLWRKKLEEVASGALRPWTSDEVHALLSTDLRSYRQIEKHLLGIVDWEGMVQDRIDYFDAIAQRMSAELLET